jgi:hypothetical protein
MKQKQKQQKNVVVKSQAMEAYECKVVRWPGSHSLDNPITDGGKVVSLTRQLLIAPQKYFLVLISDSG